MCETRIEKAANSVEGVSAADWNQKTKMIEVSFDEGMTDLKTIHKAIAEAGHDTEKYSAQQKVYDKLPGCCKYERLPAENSPDGKGDA